ncbi:MAG: ATP-binding protein [Gemmatimonadota bacterium]|nr:ATP-binding protein [Gemmatimonadota bacterium]
MKEKSKMSRENKRTVAPGSIVFGVRARLVLIITLLLAWVSGTQYAINYYQQQAVVGKLLELNRQINQAIYDIDRQIEKRTGPRVARAQPPGMTLTPSNSQVEQELKNFLDFMDGNFERFLTRPAPEWHEVSERIDRLRRLAYGSGQGASGQPGWSFFNVTVSVMDEISRRGSHWRYEISSSPALPRDDDVLQVSIPIIEEGQVRFINLQYQVSGFLESFRLYRTISLAVTLGVLALGLVLAVIVSGRFTRPIRRLNNAFRQVERGELDCRLQTGSTDEIGQLVCGFNQMVERLEQNRELEKRLHRQERLGSLGQMAAGIAHEIKNPLNAINLTIQHLGDKLHLGAPGEREHYERYSGNIQRELARLGRIVDTFLGFARVSGPERTRADLHPVIEDVLTLLAPDAEKRGVRIERAFASGPLERLVDPEKMKTVFLNLILNAIQAMPSGGRLRVATSQDSGPAQIKISDTGTGIAPGDRERIFDLYFSTKKDGSGLGLAIAGNVVRDHGGEITVASNLGTGSEFTVTIP